MSLVVQPGELLFLSAKSFLMNSLFVPYSPEHYRSRPYRCVKPFDMQVICKIVGEEVDVYETEQEAIRKATPWLSSTHPRRKVAPDDVRKYLHREGYIETVDFREINLGGYGNLKPEDHPFPESFPES